MKHELFEHKFPDSDEAARFYIFGLRTGWLSDFDKANAEKVLNDPHANALERNNALAFARAYKIMVLSDLNNG